MIGFNTIDNFSFDECLAFLTEHDSSDSSWNEVNQRYQQLLAQLQKEDDLAFGMCCTAQDYLNYLTRFKNISGASNYNPSHKVEAEEYLRNNPTPMPTRGRGLFASFLVDANKRNPITNIILYLLLFASLLVTIALIPKVIRTIQYFCEDGWPFIEAYGKGFMPGFLLSAAAFTGISRIIKWRKSGITILVVSFIIILLPTICNEFLEFICFSVSCILGVVLLWGILMLRKNGVSTWRMCKNQPRWADYVFRIVLSIWLFMIILLPPVTAYRTGFRSNLYSNGMRCLDARFSSSPYYSYDLYQNILNGSDFKDDAYEKKKAAETWLNKAKELESLEDY